MEPYAIETRQLTKIYQGRPAVDHLDLQIPQGCIYGFLGPNGAGKSTTMKMLLGLIPGEKGTIKINGLELNEENRTAILRETGSLIESPSYYGNLTAQENLKISCMLRQLPFTEIRRTLSIVRMDGQKQKRACHYSLGMKQRLGLANALLGSPRLILLDEPTNGLDPAGIHEMRALIKSLPETYGMTVMVSTHLLSEIEQIADYIGIISQGRLIFQNSLAALQSRSKGQIYLRTSDDEEAAAVLRGLPAGPGSDRISLSTSNGLLLPCLEDEPLYYCLNALLSRHIQLYRIEERGQKLEDIYLEMVKEGGL